MEAPLEPEVHDLHRYDLALPLDGLVRETQRAVEGWDWSRGAYGHALSLPAPGELHPYRRHDYQNFPCAALLGTCPLFRGIFDGLRCEKVSFRLLRRGPASSYAWHTDRWKGPGVVRFQVPILSDDAAFLVTTDYENAEQVREPAAVSSGDAFASFAAANAGHFQRHRLQPGLLHYFDTSRVHTLVNPGPSARITLSFDLLANDWVRERFPEVQAELGHGPVEPLPRPGPLRDGMNRLRAGLHPLRTAVRRWRAGCEAGGEG